ncbi:hypothetical protein JCGZ_15247 [Jatropha curcas]|uniref:Uncharacterized protein n=1 Tax=Jatropha curcas TaxID=180498 RepID=A0A067K662_JATCU|nr:hypothetical protein JCGZ_15247 [Jatropha curcas]
MGQHGFMRAVFDTVGHVWGDWCPCVRLMIYDMDKSQSDFLLMKLLASADVVPYA